jgi:hypothetical protein
MPAPTAPTPATRLCGRARRRSNRSGQGGCTNGRPDGGADGRSDSADAPKESDRHSCDGLSQQLARSLGFSGGVRGRQNAISHSAHPSFLSSHLHLMQAVMRDLRVDSATTDDIAADCIPCALSHAFRPRKDPGILTSAVSTGADAPDGTNTAYA